MALFEVVIKELHLHIDLTSVDKKADKILSEILNLQDQMAKTKEELKAEFEAGFADIGAAISDVAGDLDTLIAGTQPQGGLTEEEVEEQLAKLRTFRDSLHSVANKFPTQAP